MTHLLPSTEYKLSVEIRPLQDGFWSDAEWLTLTTRVDGLLLLWSYAAPSMYSLMEIKLINVCEASLMLLIVA